MVSMAQRLAILSLLLSLGSCLEMGEKCNEICCPENIKKLRGIYEQLEDYPLKGVFEEVFALCPNLKEEYLGCCNSSTNLEVVEDVSAHPNLGLLRGDICGPVPIEPRIENGVKARLFEFPWMALLTYEERRPCSTNCSGTVISDRYVLTAAHCVHDNPPRYVWVGKYSMKSIQDCTDAFIGSIPVNMCYPNPQEVSVEAIIIHPNYTDKPHIHHDIALLRLSNKVNFTSGSVRPVCLPVGLAQQDQDLTGLKGQIAGWGLDEKGCSNDELRKASVTINEFSKCHYMNDSNPPPTTKKQLCAGGPEDKITVCKGDSGSPLTLVGTVDDKLRTIQYGVLSIEPGTCDFHYPSLYTHVGYYMKWILDNLKP